LEMTRDVGMKLLSEELVSSEYRERLQRDLSRARICRFLIAYVSEDGLLSLGRGPLINALRDDHSFGVSSLTCACGYSPLLGLQVQLGNGNLRLKYFMDPMISDADEPDGITLFHSKLVYLLLVHERRSVVYIGSHNWSQRAIGPGRPRNAEASLRFESEFEPEHLAGIGATVAGQVNNHLMQAYNAPACIPATRANERIFEQWYQKGCRRVPGTPMQPITIILAVLKNQGTVQSSVQWGSLRNHGIYVQALGEKEGEFIYNGGDPIIVLVWNSLSELESARQPIMLHCRETTHKAGPNSQRRGTNRSSDPIMGFAAIIFDLKQLAMTHQPFVGNSSSTTLWSSRPVEFFDFEFPTQRSSSIQVDHGVKPNYQFYLEVDEVTFPVDGNHPADAQTLWTRESFAVAKSRDSAKYKDILGYEVPDHLADDILHWLTQTLGVERGAAKVLPTSAHDDPRVGKRLSGHSLHETFIGPEERERRAQFYLRAKPGALVADLDEGSENLTKTSSGQQPWAMHEKVERVQRVFVSRVDQLQHMWREIAEQTRGSGA
jgi:hypothetical protein